MKSLGMIETRGLLAAIESADVMLKAAEVSLVNKTLVGGGLVTIIVTGDVGAVKASVEAGISAVERISHDSLVSSHVIPRPHSEVEGIFLVEQESSRKNEISEAPCKDEAAKTISEPEVINDSPEQIETEIIEAPESIVADGQIANTVEEESAEKEPDVTELIPAETKDSEDGKETEKAAPAKKNAELNRKIFDELILKLDSKSVMETLGTQSVIKLRSLAREYKSELGMKSREVSDAGRERLLRSFKAYLEQKTER